MLTGQKDKGTGILVCQRGSPAKKRGYTLVEVAIVAGILSIIIGALFTSLTTGNSSISIGMAQADLQAKVRAVMDRISNDARQANLAEIDTNNPSTVHIKFRTVTGINNATGSYTLSPNYIEYDYTAASGELRRNIVDGFGAVLSTTVFNNITQPPFYADTGVALAQSPNPGNILNTKKLVVVLASQIQPKNGLILNFSLTQQLQIRNP